MESKVTVDKAWYSLQIEAFKKRLPELEKFREAIHGFLDVNTKTLFGSSLAIQSRTKTVTSFAEKAIRKSQKYTDPVNQLCDLCGIRVIAETVEQIHEFRGLLFDLFEIHEDDDVSARLRSGEFGYLSRHYIISFKPNTKGIDPALWERYSPEESARFSHLFGPRYRAELQVRTLLQHAWATVCHDSLYKGTFTPPRSSIREAGRIAALLEDADESFVRLLTAVNSLRTSYGTYMSRTQILDEIQTLQTVLENDPANPRLCKRIARLAMSAGDWDTALTVLKVHAEGTPADSSVFRDYGAALCKTGKIEQGRAFLEKAVRAAPNDVEALCLLADSCREENCEEARSSYERAFRVCPSDPRALGGYLLNRILTEKRYDFVQLVYPSLDDAIKRCRERTALRIDIPRAYYDVGFFSLLLERGYESLSAYAKALDTSPSQDWVRSARRQIDRMQLALQDKDIPELRWLQRFFFLAQFAKLTNRTGSSACPESGEPPDDGRRLRTELEALATPELRIQGPVIIIAGSCAPGLDHYLSDFKALVLSGFKGFAGTVISGGTTAGISNWAGDLENGRILKVAHLPGGELPQDVRIDERYQRIIRMAEEKEFGPGLPLQYWTDILASGIAPETVRLLGVGGGALSAFEYKLALALGAKVGILRDSGRAAEELLRDPDWENSEDLAALPADRATVRMFLQPVKPGVDLEPEAREHLAQIVHENYLEKKRKTNAANDLSANDWHELREDFRNDNREQVDSILAKLESIGLSIQKPSRREPVLMTFTPEEVESMAELEHGRWNANRLLQGWRFGPADKANKVSEYLVPWSGLPESIKEFDREPVRLIPSLLQRLGYEIVRPPSPL